MKMKQTFILCLALSLSAIPAAAQEQPGNSSGALTIEQCYRAAEKNYPLARQYELISKTRDYTVSNAARAYLPQVTFSAKASWQSDVTKFSVDREKFASSSYAAMLDYDELAGMIPSISKDQYGASIDINQTIWDGGAVKAQKELAEKEAETDAKSTGSDLYGLRERVNELFFGIILMQSNIELSELMLGSLDANCARVSSYLENGITGQSDLDAVRIQILKTKQEILSLRNAKKSYCTMLALLTGLDIDGDTVLEKPEEISSLSGDIRRPELALFEAQKSQIESRNRMLNAGLTPKFGLYVTGGYGRPGLNMLDNSFKPYMMAGVRMTWNIGNFYNLKNNRRLLETKMASVENGKSAFLLNTGIDISRKDSEIETLRGQLSYDDEIIGLRKSVLKANEEKMAEGTISGTDLVGYMNDALAAEQDKALHEVKMLLAMYNLRFVRGE